MTARSLLPVVALILAFAADAGAQAITVAWDPSASATGYRLWRGTTSGNYATSVDVGNVTEYTYTDLPPDQTHYVAVQAYNASQSSVLSSEIVLRVAVTPPTFTPFELILRNDATGAVNSWKMSGTDLYSTEALSPDTVDPSWTLVASADLTGEGEPDLIWRSSTGSYLVWQMSGSTRIATLPLNPGQVSISWRIAAILDMNRDGKQDLVWQSNQGIIGVWLMDGVRQTSNAPFSPNNPGAAWRLEAAADLTGDGNEDLIFRNTAGNIGLWAMNGLTRTAVLAMSPNNVGPNWRIVNARDLNNDGHTDVIWQSLVDQSLAVWWMNGVNKTGGIALAPNHLPKGWSVSAVRR
jgi:hypothetical protein